MSILKEGMEAYDLLDRKSVDLSNADPATCIIQIKTAKVKLMKKLNLKNSKRLSTSPKRRSVPRSLTKQSILTFKPPVTSKITLVTSRTKSKLNFVQN